jgi:hypothetical protein
MCLRPSSPEHKDNFHYLCFSYDCQMPHPNYQPSYSTSFFPLTLFYIRSFNIIPSTFHYLSYFSQVQLLFLPPQFLFQLQSPILHALTHAHTHTHITLLPFATLRLEMLLKIAAISGVTPFRLVRR